MPAERVFLDTSGWIALLNRSDDLHDGATRRWSELRQAGATIVVTD